METLIEGATGTAQDPAGSSAADIVARLKAQSEPLKAVFQAMDPAVAPPVPAIPVETQAKPKAPEKAQPSAEQPPQKTDGPIDPDLAKEQKVNENLERTIQDKEARIQQILRQREDLKKKLYSKGREAAELTRQAETPSPPQARAEDFRGLTPEFKQKFLQTIEEDPVEAIFKAAEIVVETRGKATQEELLRMRQERQIRQEAERIDSLGQAGHSWVYTPEGQQWFQEIFQQEPGLTQMSDPYGAAFKMFGDQIPFKEARTASPAQAARGTPILGVSSAMPPPNSTPAATPEKKLEALNIELQMAIQTKDVETQRRIGSEMEKIWAGTTFRP